MKREKKRQQNEKDYTYPNIHSRAEKKRIIKIEYKQVLITSASICKVHLKKNYPDDTDYDNETNI